MYLEWKDGKAYNINGEEVQFLSDKSINEFHIRLDTEEEYEMDSLAADYGDFIRFMENCPSVYATTNDFEKYLSEYGKKRKLYPKRYHIANSLAKGILEQGFDPELLPFIPIVEYKLVPTGVMTYYDPRSNEYDRKQIQIQEDKEIRKLKKGKKRNIWQQREAEKRELNLRLWREMGLKNKGLAHAKKGEKRIRKEEKKDEE